MSDLLHKINARLQHYNRDELMALIWDFLSDRDYVRGVAHLYEAA